MAQLPAIIIAQFAIDFATDLLSGESFGMNESTFAVIVASTIYTIELEPESLADVSQRQVVTSVVGVGVGAGPIVVAPSGPGGLTIISTVLQTVVDQGPPVTVNVSFQQGATTDVVQFTVLRQGVVS